MTDSVTYLWQTLELKVTNCMGSLEAGHLSKWKVTWRNFKKP